MLPNQPTLDEVEAMQMVLNEVRRKLVAAQAPIASERPIENPIAQLGRLRATTFAAPQESPPSPGGAALPPPPPQAPYFERPLEFDTEEPDFEAMIEADTNISRLPVDDSTWRDMMFKPGMAAAMMFVLHPVVEAAADGLYTDLEEVVSDLQAWDRMTIVEQVALTELFAWVEMEVGRGEDSMIPTPLRANMQRAYENYSQGSA